MMGLLLSTEDSRALDLEAQREWHFNVFGLIEAAGRLCAQALQRGNPGLFENQPVISVAAGTGNNGADAMIMLRHFILSGLVKASSSAIVVSRMPKSGEAAPWAELLRSLIKMKVAVLTWSVDTGETGGRPSAVCIETFAASGIIIDGIAGTGISGPLRGAAQEMTSAINSLKKPKPLVVSVDVPSGISDEWKPGMPVIEADITLAIEVQKYCLYTPAARPYAGNVIPVSGIFPDELCSSYKGAEILDWKHHRKRIPKIRPEAYKNKRGTVEIRAGSTGTTGAAIIAGRGAQAAGAGLVRLVVDSEIYPIIASRASGVMVSRADESVEKDSDNRFKPDAVLLGPGWGKTENRRETFEKALSLEEAGIPLILDADAIELAKDKVFHRNVILTPHPGELSVFTNLSREELLCRPLPVLKEFARKSNVTILFKSHVIFIVSADGRVGILDGMLGGLASGGSGDLLAGFCAAIAARMRREGGTFDAYNCAAAGAALLIASGESLAARFTDPLELADAAANLAGEAWLLQKTDYINE